MLARRYRTRNYMYVFWFLSATDDQLVVNQVLEI